MQLAFRILFNADAFTLFRCQLMEIGRGANTRYYILATDSEGERHESFRFAYPADANRAMQELLKWARENQ